MGRGRGWGRLSMRGGAGVRGGHRPFPEGVKCELGTLLRFRSQAVMWAPRGQLL